MDREEIINDLIERKRLWPLMSFNSCHFCAAPRRPEHARYPTCWNCNELHKRYGRTRSGTGGRPGQVQGALADLVPITYTTKRWPLGAGLREFKDDHHADPSHVLAARFGAVLSAFLEHQLQKLMFPWPGAHLIPAPSSKPVIVSAVERARREGWYAPELDTDIVSANPDAQRQRERAGNDRAVITDKWRVNSDAFRYSHMIILDDMTTTGGTLHSLAAALLAQGAGSVQAVVLARNLGSDGDWILPLLEERNDRGARWSPAVAKRDIIR